MTKRKTTTKKAPTKHTFAGFVNITLGKSDKEKINAEHDGYSSECFQWLDAMVEDGYAFKFAYDEYAECTAVMMIGEYTKEFNQGKIMSARHKSFRKCLSILRYKHEVMSGSENWDKGDDLFPEHDW